MTHPLGQFPDLHRHVARRRQREQRLYIAGLTLVFAGACIAATYVNAWIAEAARAAAWGL